MPTPLETWVSDQLLAHLGASDSTTVSYFVTLASTAQSPSDLVATLSANGLTTTAATQRFANELYERAPRKAKGGTSQKAEANALEARRKAEREKLQLKGAKFSLMMDDDDQATVAAEAGPAKKKTKRSSTTKRGGGDSLQDEAAKATTIKSSSSSSRKIRKRGDHDGTAWASSDEEEREIKRRREEERYGSGKRSPRRDPGSDKEDADDDEDEDPELRRERERLADLAERDAFAARMRDKDKDRTKKLVEDRSSSSSKKLDPEAALRAKLAASDSTTLLDPKEQIHSLRDASRQAYLGKREQQQLDLLRIEIADWERDFKGVKLTKREQQEYERKKELLRLAEERLAIDEGGDHYQMPDGESSQVFKGCCSTFCFCADSSLIHATPNRVAPARAQTTLRRRARSTRSGKRIS